jgi:hypothetical protein
VTAGPLHGPPTFAQWVKTCTVEVELTGLAADVTAEAELDSLTAGLTTEVEVVDLLAPAR